MGYWELTDKGWRNIHSENECSYEYDRNVVILCTIFDNESVYDRDDIIMKLATLWGENPKKLLKNLDYYLAVAFKEDLLTVYQSKTIE